VIDRVIQVDVSGVVMPFFYGAVDLLRSGQNI